MEEEVLARTFDAKPLQMAEEAIVPVTYTKAVLTSNSSSLLVHSPKVFCCLSNVMPRSELRTSARICIAARVLEGGHCPREFTDK